VSAETSVVVGVEQPAGCGSVDDGGCHLVKIGSVLKDHFKCSRRRLVDQTTNLGRLGDAGTGGRGLRLFGDGVWRIDKLDGKVRQVRCELMGPEVFKVVREQSALLAWGSCRTL